MWCRQCLLDTMKYIRFSKSLKWKTYARWKWTVFNRLGEQYHLFQTTNGGRIQIWITEIFEASCGMTFFCGILPGVSNEWLKWDSRELSQAIFLRTGSKELPQLQRKLFLLVIHTSNNDWKNIHFSSSKRFHLRIWAEFLKFRKYFGQFMAKSTIELRFFE